MPQLGFQEMIVVLIIALLVFGPKKLPELGKSLGKGLREFKKATNELKSNWEEHIREAETSIQDVKQTVHETSSGLTADLNHDAKALDAAHSATEAPKEPAVTAQEAHDGRSN